MRARMASGRCYKTLDAKVILQRAFDTRRISEEHPLLYGKHWYGRQEAIGVTEVTSVWMSSGWILTEISLQRCHHEAIAVRSLLFLRG